MELVPDTLKPLKTWSHLAGKQRRPTEYEIVSTNLLWTDWDDKPFAMGRALPLSQWMVKYRNQSPLRHPDWNAFRDPDRMIYRTYNTIQDGQESYVDGLFVDHKRNEHDSGLPESWVEQLSVSYTPMRYLMHAMQMSANYLVTVAPSSPIMNCFIFQAGDFLRWVSRTAYRTAELRDAFPGVGFARVERGHWETHPSWQGFRELVERGLSTWDWAEHFVFASLVARPAIDAALLSNLARTARANYDSLTGVLCDAQLIDSERGRRWSSALVKFAKEREGNEAVIDAWLEKWVPLGDRAIRDYGAGLDPSGELGDEGVTAARRIRQYMLS